MEDYFTKLKIEAKMNKALEELTLPAQADKVAVPLCSSVTTWTGTQKRCITNMLIWEAAAGIRIEDAEIAECSNAVFPDSCNEDTFFVSYGPDGKIVQPSETVGEWISAITLCDPVQGDLEILCMRPFKKFSLAAADCKEVEDSIKSGQASSLFSLPVEYSGKAVFKGENIPASWMLFCMKAGKTPKLYGQSRRTDRGQKFKLENSMGKSQLPRDFREVFKRCFAKIPVSSSTPLAELCERWLGTVPESLADAVSCLWTPDKKKTPLNKKKTPLTRKQAEKQALSDKLDRFILPAAEKEKLMQYIKNREIGMFGGECFAWPCLDEEQNLVLICYWIHDSHCTEWARGVCNFKTLLWKREAGAADSFSKIQNIPSMHPYHRKMVYLPKDVLADLLAAMPRPWSRLAECYQYQDMCDHWKLSPLRVTSFQNALGALQKPTALQLLLSEGLLDEASEVQQGTGTAARQKCSSLEELYEIDVFPEWLKTLNPTWGQIRAVGNLKAKHPEMYAAVPESEMSECVKQLPRTTDHMDTILCRLLENLIDRDHSFAKTKDR